MTNDASPRSGRAKAMTPEERTETILDAARAVFLEKGFAAARVEDVARRAGIAKGTVYLHFNSKEALFKALIRSTAASPIGHIRTLLEDEERSSAELLRLVTGVISTELLGTERRLVLRLLITEGPRFPDIATFHHEEVVSRAMTLLRSIVSRGIARGEFDSDALERFPQLFAAPMLLAIIWEALFAERDPLDVDAMLEAHLELVLRGMGAGR